MNIRDIAHALANTCRFTGHCRRFYSVAEHSLHVSKLVSPINAMWGLLHDASESYLADLSAPLKDSFPNFVMAEKRLMSAICDRFSISHAEPEEVKAIDRSCLVAEARELMYANWTHLAPPVLIGFSETLSNQQIEAAFIERFRQLGGIE